LNNLISIENPSLDALNNSSFRAYFTCVQKNFVEEALKKSSLKRGR